MNELKTRHTVESLFRLKLNVLKEFEILEESNTRIHDLFQEVNGYSPFRIEWSIRNFGRDRIEKYIDQVIWRYLVNLHHLEKYMLATEYKKMLNEIDNFQTPDFTVENAKGWLDSLQDMIFENVRLMMKRVYSELITKTYHVGGKWNGPKKKRNNNGVDKFFILSTGDYSRVFGFWNPNPTITDDLEKVCYLLDGKTLPEKTIIARAKSENLKEVECPYFTVKFHKNGNTHYRLTDETRDRLNRIGPDGNLIGEKIRIKVFED